MRLCETWSCLAGRATIAFLFIAQDASAQAFWNGTANSSSTAAGSGLIGTGKSSSSFTTSRSSSTLTSATILTSLSSTGGFSNTSTLVSTSPSGVSATGRNTSLSSSTSASTTASGTHVSPSGTGTVSPGSSSSSSTLLASIVSGTGSNNASSLPSTATSGTHVSSNGTGTVSPGSSTLVSSSSSSSAGTGTATGSGNATSTPSGVFVGVITSIIVESGTTATREIITEGSQTNPITLAPVTTTFVSSAATSAVSSASSQIAAIVPVILAWKKGPTPNLKTDALNKIKGLQDDLAGVIPSLGVKPSSNPCGGGKKRFKLPIISDIVNALSCITGQLNDITGKITGGVVEGVDDIISEIDSKTDELDNDEEDKSSSNSEESKTSTSSESSESSCTQTKTAFEVTITCSPTIISTQGSMVTTSTCLKTNTVTTTGCSVTGGTTTISSSASADNSEPTPCGADNCGDTGSCPFNPKPPATPGGGLPPPATSNLDCKAFPTVTITANDDVDAVPTITGTTATVSGELSQRTLIPKPVNAHDAAYVEELADQANRDDTILPLRMGGVYTDGEFYPYPDPNSGRHVFGLQALTGCTAVVIASNKGVYISHIWEVGGFLSPTPVDANGHPYVERTRAEFRDIAINPLRRGGPDTTSIRDLIGTDNHPGRLHATHQPKIFVITPYTTDWDENVRQPPITTTFRHQDLAQYLLDSLAAAVPGAQTKLDGYFRSQSQQEEGMVWLEVDRAQRLERRQGHSDRQIGKWRVWAGPDLVEDREFRVTRRRQRGGRKRELGGIDMVMVIGAMSKRDTLTSQPETAEDPDGDYEGDDGEEVDEPNPCPNGTGSGPGSGTNSTSTTSTTSTTSNSTSTGSNSASASGTSVTSLTNTGSLTSLTKTGPPTTSIHGTTMSTSASSSITNAHPITSCSLPTQSGPSSATTSLLPSACACNDGQVAKLGTTIGPDKATTYTCEVGTTRIDVSTDPAPKPTPTPTPTPTPPPFKSGTCNLHIAEARSEQGGPLYVNVAVHDDSNAVLHAQSYKGNFGDTVTIAKADSKLPYDVSAFFSTSTKALTRRDLRPRIGAPAPVNLFFEKLVVGVTAGDNKWDSTVTDTTKSPHCNVGDWDNGNFDDFLDGLLSLGADSSIPNRQMDCSWPC